MPTNDFIGFASNGSANIMSQADYAAAAEQGNGVQSGMASSKLANKAWRQGANMAAALGRLIAARGYDALDNGDLDALQSSVDDAISLGAFNRMFFSQTSGSFTAPRTGVYRIMIKGGGGGGGGGAVSSYYTGASGGEGATLIFYETLTDGQSYNYVIGAGGAAGTNDNSSPTNGGDGGSSSFNSSYSVDGGDGGNAAIGTGLRGGGGGGSYSAPGASTVFFIPGVGGQPAFRSAGSTWLSGQTIGGGAGGGQAGAGMYGGGGGGGGGAGSAKNPSAGGDGFILIEYAG